MPLISVLWGAFLTIIVSAVGKILVGLGFGIVTFLGVKAGIDWFTNAAVSKLSGLPADVLGALSMAGLGNCISIISSALIIRAILTGLNLLKDKKSNLSFMGGN